MTPTRLRVLISPALTMEGSDDLDEGTEPLFWAEAERLQDGLRALGPEGRKRLWAVSDRLAERWEAALDAWEPLGGSWAMSSFRGIQYQHLAPQVLSEGGWDYVEAHLRMGSGLFGILRPQDRVMPYRLEMAARLAVGGHRDLYGFWGDRLARTLFPQGRGLLVNCASKEYARSVLPWLGEGVRVVTCLFGTVGADGRFRQRAQTAKAARGDFCRWLAEQDVTDPARFGEFTIGGHRLDSDRSGGDTLVFVREGR